MIQQFHYFWMFVRFALIIHVINSLAVSFEILFKYTFSVHIPRRHFRNSGGSGLWSLDFQLGFSMESPDSRVLTCQSPRNASWVIQKLVFCVINIDHHAISKQSGIDP